MSDLVFNAIVAMRGGIPETCDYCGGKFTETNHPVPDEAQTWSCTDCWKVWEPVETTENISPPSE